MRCAPLQNSDSGISKHKLVAVYHINGKIPYASIGFAGLTGALTGMSAAGITVHGALQTHFPASVESC